MLNNREPLEDILRTIESGLRLADNSPQFNDEMSISPKLFKLSPFYIGSYLRDIFLMSTVN